MRPERRGGRDHRWIGQELSAFGLPMHLRLSDELEASRRIKALIAGALASRAIGAPVADGFAKVRLGVELAELWCAPSPAGAPGPFVAQVALQLHALHMPRGEVWHSERFAARVDGAANCAVALRRLLDRTSDDLAAAFGRAPLRDRLLGSAPPPPVVEPPPPPVDMAPPAELPRDL